MFHHSFHLKNLVKTIYYYLFSPVYRRLNRSPLFDREFYLNGNPDVKEEGMDPLVHFIKTGWHEKREPSLLFDSKYYTTQNPDIKKTEEIPLNHYLMKGIAENRRPCRWFDPDFYSREYLQSGSSQLSAPEHFYQHGVLKEFYSCQKVKDLSQKPLISIVVPVYNVSVAYLNRCLNSVLFQSYPHWQLCIADDCSDNDEIRQTLDKWRLLDQRIQVLYLNQNLGISGATNAAAKIATGDFIGFLDNDDEMSPQCLFEVVKTIGETGADFIYSDENLVNSTSRITDQFYKPDFNRELLLCHNYITHFVVVKRCLFQQVNGFSVSMNGAQDFDLALKLSEIAANIVHIPKCLYHWRASETSTSINHSQKEYANEAGKQAVMAALKRTNIRGEVEFSDWKFYYKTIRNVHLTPLISIIVDFGDTTKTFSNSIENILDNTDYPNFELLIIVIDSDESFNKISRTDSRISFIVDEEGEGKTRLLNRVAQNISGEYLVFLHGNILPQNNDWIQSLLGYAQDDHVGVVGGRLTVNSGQEEVNLTVPDLSNHSPVYYADFFQGCSTHMNGLQCPQNVLTPPRSLYMVSKNKFIEVGGFNKSLQYLFFTHDFCLRLHKKGYTNIYSPHCIALVYIQLELPPVEKLEQEQKIFQSLWRELLLTGDPYWNIGLLNEKEISLELFLQWYTGLQKM